MRKIILSAIAVTLISSCASPKYKFIDFFSGKYSADLGLPDDTLSEQELAELTFVNERGEMLRKYDYYSWIGSDELEEQYDINKNIDSITSWIFIENNQIPTVYFGRLKNDKFEISKTIEWIGDSSILSKKRYVKDNISKMALAQENAIKINKEYLTKNHPSTNTYTFVYGDKIDVYLIPATTRDDLLLYCGGLRSTFDETGVNLIKNDSLHASTIILRSGSTSQMTHRTSSMGTIYNEVDYFQSYLYSKVVQAQYISIIKKPRMVSFISNGDEKPVFRILKDVNRKNVD